MPRASGSKDYVSLAKGLITEASPLAFPEGSTSDELNFVIEKDGLIRRRRKGFEMLYPVSSFSGEDSVLENIFYWRGSTYVVAVLTNSVPETYLRVHSVDESFTALIDIKIADDKVETQIAELTEYLVITLSNNDKPILLEYSELTQNIDVYKVDLYIRDFELVDDGLSISENPSSLSDNHRYNLLNAGWFADRKDQNTSGNPLKNVITAYREDLGVYPSNADIVSVGMIDNSEGVRTFDPEFVRDAGLGNSLAARGHYVYPIGDINRTSKLSSPKSDGAPSTTLSLIGSVDLSGAPSYNPNVPVAPPGVPFDPFPNDRRFSNPGTVPGGIIP